MKISAFLLSTFILAAAFAEKTPRKYTIKELTANDSTLFDDDYYPSDKVLHQYIEGDFAYNNFLANLESNKLLRKISENLSKLTFFNILDNINQSSELKACLLQTSTSGSSGYGSGSYATSTGSTSSSTSFIKRIAIQTSNINSAEFNAQIAEFDKWLVKEYGLTIIDGKKSGKQNSLGSTYDFIAKLNLEDDYKFFEDKLEFFVEKKMKETVLQAAIQAASQAVSQIVSKITNKEITVQTDQKQQQQQQQSGLSTFNQHLNHQSLQHQQLSQEQQQQSNGYVIAPPAQGYVSPPNAHYVISVKK